MRARVLVVDDDPALAEMLGIVLRSEGFLPSFVADGERALAAFREARPDIVLLDLMLPGMSGIDVCRAIRAEAGVPIVMLTAKSDTVDVVLGLESGADDYVVKPFKPRSWWPGCGPGCAAARTSPPSCSPSGPAGTRSRSMCRPTPCSATGTR
jgi:two-component system, OmpR family, response regulator MtrA